MKKTEKLRTRRQRALHALAWALGLLLTCNYVLHFGYLLPIQAFRCAEQREGVYERERVVAARWEPGMMHATDRLYLAEGKNCLSLGCTSLSLFGWDASFVWPVDTASEGDAHLGLVQMSRKGHEHTVVFYGRIDEADVTRLELHGESMDGNNGFALGVSRDDWFIKDGKTYLLLPDPYQFTKGEYAEYSLVVETEDGGTVEYAVEQSAGVSWG